ncbi:MAG: HAD-IC family P-type ATPase [Anaerolineae bacterium]|nr:HAD-IC family P-type ATPase [Anaerolineae bacterium]MDW8098154.1 HAD-IC family P-type ATPase [Anaerolineae bacterium]
MGPVVRMEKFAHQIAFVVLAFASLLGVIAFARGMPFHEVLFLVIAMAVSAIPEGLPVAMTVALSLATARMARRHVIVRRLAAVESLGSCTVIASDKTGTLTVNQQTVRAVVFPDGTRVAVSGQGYNDRGEVIRVDGGEIDGVLADRLAILAREAILYNETVLERTDNG